MKYGYFDDHAREYVITTPGTPLPWINYLGSEDFFGLVSNTGGGYCFYQDARLRRIIRFRYNEPGGDIGGRFFYIKEKGMAAWSPAFLPCKNMPDTYRCRHGIGYTVFESEKNGLKAELTLTIPLGETCELHRIRLENHSKEEKQFSLYAAVEWCLWDAVDDAQNYQRNLSTGEVETEPGIIYHKTEYRERRDHYAFYGTAEACDGFDSDRDSFTGRFGGWSAPECVAEGISRQSIAHGWYPIACHRKDYQLAPGETAEIVFILGYAENDRAAKFISPNVIRKDGAHRLIAKYSRSSDVAAALRDLKMYWDGLLGNYSVSSGNEKLDRMVNIWNQYQCMVTFNMSRSASYYETGTGRGMGFRDSCQDLLGFVHMVPERARQRIIDIASVQFEDGSTYHQYQPLTKRGNDAVGSGFNDDPLWLIAAVCAYVKETGDFGILSHPTPFDTTPGTEVPLMEHLHRSISFTLSHLGPHRLPLIGHADWNDCLNLNCFSEEPGESFQLLSPEKSAPETAESVLIAGLFVYYGRQYAKLCRRYAAHGSSDDRDYLEEAEMTEKAVEAMVSAVMTDGWDGEWYLRAYDALGEKVGSRENEEGKILIESQGFCAMAEIGRDRGYSRKALDSTDRYLGFEYGTELLWPRYTVYHPELGEISSYPPGYKENGAVFCHNNPWVSIAEAIHGNGERAFNIYRKVAPAWIEDISEIHRTEPYVYCQMVAGRDAALPGEGKNAWLTGTSAWSFVDISQFILGIFPEYDGLRIHPCLPSEIREYTVRRRFRGTEYIIHVINDGLGGADVLIPFEEGKAARAIEVHC